MTLGPFSHLAQRFGGVPAGLVGSVGRDCVIDVADGTHLGKQGDLVGFQPFRVAAAVDLFVVVQADIERDFRHVGALQQGSVAVFGVFLDLGELLVGQLSRLVEDGVRHHCLAQVVQQAGQAGQACLLFIEAQLA